MTHVSALPFLICTAVVGGVLSAIGVVLSGHGILWGLAAYSGGGAMTMLLTAAALVTYSGK